MTVQGDSIQELANQTLNAFSARNGLALLYAEVEDGVISADLFFQLNGKSAVQFRFAPSELRELVYSVWESGFANAMPRSWATMRLVVADGRVSVDLQYPDQIDPDEDVSDRRPQIVSNLFSGAAIDYSRA